VDVRNLDRQPTAHGEAAVLFSSYAEGGDDPVVKAFAGKTLPKLGSTR